MSPVFNAIRAVQNAIACPILGANQFVLGSVGSFVPGLNVPALAAIRALRRLYGCNEADDVGEPEPPYTGGQCNGFCYRFEVVSETIVGTAVNPYLAIGPIQGIRWIPQPGGGPIEVLCRSLGNPASTFACRPQLPLDWYGGFGGGSLISQPRIQNVTVLGGFADVCGDLPGVYPPPTTTNFDIDITYNNEEGDEVTVTIPFVFAPIKVDFNGDLRLPFTFDFGGNTFTGNFALNPELNLTINPPGLPTGSEQGTEELPPGDPEEEVEPLPVDEKIIGVVVNSSIVGEQQFTTILTQGMPNILAPRAGSIKFAYSLGAATFWSNDIDVKGDRIFIPCPFSQGADAVVVSPAPGVALQWVPISGPPLATKADVA